MSPFWNPMTEELSPIINPLEKSRSMGMRMSNAISKFNNCIFLCVRLS